MIVIAITICGWFCAHVVTCLGVTCFCGCYMYGCGLNFFLIVQLFRGSCCTWKKQGWWRFGAVKGAVKGCVSAEWRGMGGVAGSGTGEKV